LSGGHGPPGCDPEDEGNQRRPGPLSRGLVGRAHRTKGLLIHAQRSRDGRDGAGEPSAVSDALIVGAKPAGWSAAPMLGGCRRRVLVVDSGQPPDGAAGRCPATSAGPESTRASSSGLQRFSIALHTAEEARGLASIPPQRGCDKLVICTEHVSRWMDITRGSATMSDVRCTGVRHTLARIGISSKGPTGTKYGTARHSGRAGPSFSPLCKIETVLSRMISTKKCRKEFGRCQVLSPRGILISRDSNLNYNRCPSGPWPASIVVGGVDPGRT
jgi:hypothetical protein